MKYRKSIIFFICFIIFLFVSEVGSQSFAARVTGEEGVVSSGGSVKSDRPVKEIKTLPKASKKIRPAVEESPQKGGKGSKSRSLR